MTDRDEEAAREDAMRDVERVMMYIAQAQRKADEIAQSLAKTGTDEQIVAALQTASGALRAEHNRLLNRTHFVVPDEPLTALPDVPAEDDPGNQQRMAI